MRQRMPFLLAAAACACVGLLAGLIAACADAGAKLPPPLKVDHVIDGDTIVVLKADGLKQRVRLADVDAPETPRGKQGKSEPCGAEATVFLEGFLDSVNVQLEETGIDHYGRVVAYVWIQPQVLVNAEMIRSGYARLALPATGRRNQALAEAQGEAMTAKRGLWGGDCEKP